MYLELVLTCEKFSVVNFTLWSHFITKMNMLQKRHCFVNVQCTNSMCMCFTCVQFKFNSNLLWMYVYSAFIFIAFHFLTTNNCIIFITKKFLTCALYFVWLLAMVLIYMYFLVSQIQTGGLVLLPTRELASQVAEVLQYFLPSHLSLFLLIGGAEVAADIQAINTKG